MNASAVANSFESSYGFFASMIGGIVVLALFSEALIVLWKSAKRARANDMRMLSDAVVLELVMESDLLIDKFFPVHFISHVRIEFQTDLC